ncbi:26S proteasome non-ATPase regulatory subunit 9 [Vespa crabro]|uniref:26S proteasome non-ATPase regulatory subunit 9 n=1 Tax=Vespa crabro TaxID=7445 RepID=UPI001F003EFE|nr:26S proteasome non-ATPase regulatory subunit 9 [Vespa crabro]XP_046822350.1 26S proteasome non-ATPase regulatory subunit 9 [Vespa crabro]
MKTREKSKMVVDMELQEAKDEVLRFIKDRDKIESDIRALRDVLDSNHVGMDDPLVDSEGYPRQDINVYQVRHARHRIICLTNDHKALMKKIEEGLHKVHSIFENQPEEPIATTSDIEEPFSTEPFLRVNLVSPSSPAEVAGIQVDDLIIEFGSINYGNFKTLKDIATLVEHSRYKSLDIKLKRGSSILALTLIPRPWDGNGLLGCNVIPLEVVER